jgi:hypothetical protein
VCVSENREIKIAPAGVGVGCQTLDTSTGSCLEWDGPASEVEGANFSEGGALMCVDLGGGDGVASGTSTGAAACAGES